MLRFAILRAAFRSTVIREVVAVPIDKIVRKPNCSHRVLLSKFTALPHYFTQSICHTLHYRCAACVYILYMAGHKYRHMLNAVRSFVANVRGAMLPLLPSDSVVQSRRYCAKLTNELDERTRCVHLCVCVFVLCFAASKVDNMMPCPSSLPCMHGYLSIQEQQPGPNVVRIRVRVGRLRVKQFLHSQLLLNSITVSCQSGESAPFVTSS